MSLPHVFFIKPFSETTLKETEALKVSYNFKRDTRNQRRTRSCVNNVSRCAASFIRSNVRDHGGPRPRVCVTAGHDWLLCGAQPSVIHVSKDKNTTLKCSATESHHFTLHANAHVQAG